MRAFLKVIIAITLFLSLFVYLVDYGFRHNFRYLDDSEVFLKSISSATPLDEFDQRFGPRESLEFKQIPRGNRYTDELVPLVKKASKHYHWYHNNWEIYVACDENDKIVDVWYRDWNYS